jgi:hypothetical protein
MKKVIIKIALIFFLPIIAHSQSPYPSLTNGNAIAQYLQPVVQSIESITSTSFVINASVRAVAPRRDRVCFRFDIAIDSSFSNSSIVQRDLFGICVPPIPNCLGRGYLDSAVQFQVQISQLQPNKQYYISIYSSSLYSDAYLNSLRRIYIITTLLTSPPSQPILALPQTITTSSASVRWSMAQGFPANYSLTVATDSSFRAVLPQYANVTLGDTQNVISGLSSQTQYFVRVRAANAQGFSPFSQTVRFQTLSNNANLFSAESRTSPRGFPSSRTGSEYYKLGTNNLTLIQTDSVVAELVRRTLPVVEAWSQDNNTCVPPLQSASEIVVRMKEPTTVLTALGFIQTPVTWSDSCSCKSFRVYGNFPTSTSVHDESQRVSVDGISPNPASESATFSFSLPAPVLVRLTLHDALGREVVRVPEQMYAAGAHEISFAVSALPTGIYFLRYSIGERVLVRRVVVVR